MKRVLWQNQDQLWDSAYGGAAAVVALVMRGEPTSIRISIATLVSGVALSYILARPIAHWVSVNPDWRVPIAFGLGFVAYFLLKGVITIGMDWAEKPLRFLSRLPFLGYLVRKD